MIFIIFILGASFASFITLIAQRLTLKQLPWLPKYSYCDNCKKQLTWWQLIPILGFLIQKGQCYYCNAKINIYFPLVELLSGLSFVLLINSSLLHNAFLLIPILTLIFNSTTDFFDHFIYSFSLLGLLPLLFIHGFLLKNILATIIISSFLLTYTLFTHTLGIGDIEYLFIICLVFGWKETILIIQGASIIMLIFLTLNKDKRLPFIPSLSLTTLPFIYLAS